MSVEIRRLYLRLRGKNKFSRMIIVMMHLEMIHDRYDDHERMKVVNLKIWCTIVLQEVA